MQPRKMPLSILSFRFVARRVCDERALSPRDMDRVVRCLDTSQRRTIVLLCTGTGVDVLTENWWLMKSLERGHTVL